MTSQKLYGILKYLDSLDTKVNLQSALEAVRDALNQLVSAPAQPQHQNNLATALANLDTAADKLRGSITPSQAVSINEMGGEDFFEPSIAAKVKGWVQTNAMTPSVARDSVTELVARRAAFLNTVRTARQNLEKLGVKESALQPGAGDIAFLIPRDIFDNELGAFAKELTFISRLMQDIGEALTGQAQRVEVEQLSSSVPTVALLVDLAVLTAIGTVVNKFLDAWQKIERIRKVRGELTEIGLKGAAVEELSEQINPWNRWSKNPPRWCWLIPRWMSIGRGNWELQ
jgi:hypothetical protein